MDNQGWIKLYRKLEDHPIMQDATALQIFIWILMKVNYKTGELTTGRFIAAEVLKMKPRTFHKALLERVQNKYKLVTLSSDNRKTTILVNKWRLYQQDSDTSSDTQVTTKGQQSDTIQEYKNIRSITNNAPAEADVDLDNLLVEGNNTGITKEFQLLGLDIFELTHAPADKKSECMRIAKKYPEGTVMSALSFAKDYPKKELKWKMFLWKLNSYAKTTK